MVSVPNVSYQPAAAYQGEHVNTPQQEPKSGETQPKQAPSADSQRGDQDNTRQESSSSDRGKTIDVKA